MSVINKALSDMTDKKPSASRIEKVDVAPIRSGKKKWWLTGGVLLALIAYGLWALLPVKQQPEPESIPEITEQSAKKNVTTVVTLESTSPTKQSVEESVSSIYEESEKLEQLSGDFVDPESDLDDIVSESVEETKATPGVVAVERSQPTKTNPPANTEKSKTVAAKPKPVEVKAERPKTEEPKVTKKTEKAKPSQANESKTTAIASANPTPKVVEDGAMVIQQVELTPQQLAEKALSRAKKALDSNDFDGAIKGYRTALRYVPKDDVVRKKLAALYYGRGDVRQSLEILQQGIVLNKDSQTLRLAAMNILVKEGITEAALGVLEYLPPSPSMDYLSARAGLAQQLKKHELALESYQMLVNKDQDNGKWWLGLAIQQERNEEFSKAKNSYEKALNRVGLSARTNQFIRERISYLSSKEATSNAN
ncbi:MSHA biogenesis protein MshN [Vibrio nigripulchritudo]|uniref:MSHA biogenesis protein MshN n=1 Tax=Vibrio nigripulchritudo TaxID=28173 RepID=UPI00190A550B|nr:MSHA biogenesis protein MshN [Vibrio nigripulchritudo]BCL68509.1 MSHA biogenesis protein MshN [Vibrio nigripulchritudo]BDU29838.1 MSHA biogenesis protein MshN [Vibrio nigripulchritudo]